MNFEYKIINYNDFISDDNSSHDLNIGQSFELKKEKEISKLAEKRLDKLGKEGWELITIVNNKLFLKRAT
ncbi:MAG TPA: hypothetical protein EYO89_00700 [Candidatus Dadabacteria bacterium]|nr:hypothetical protein [Candidatus Dadabacteria bacterium]